ncbi:CDGSH iron-sulfur domain-containing protein [Nocardioides sambongensis]|uniref:CDGSH iron-sulfur domain-containing protein n=1 Tax=Nocardioides sambongensis TaxID=2589074 RepID=UPI00112806F4|nr:CDGSH iron-sulfur domain-containing protein [Nocardioides sambongensis]
MSRADDGGDRVRPVVVRGATMLAGTDGVVHRVERPVVALCVCGRSAAYPWCDSTHKVLADRPRS